MKITLDYFRLGRIILLVVAVILVGQVLLAQKTPKAPSEPENKIRMKIYIEKDGEKKAFEKEYNNQSDLQNDPELKAFKQDLALDEKHTFFFNEDSSFKNHHFTMINPAFENKSGDNRLMKFHFRSSDSLDELVAPEIFMSFDFDSLMEKAIRIERFGPDSLKKTLHFNYDFPNEEFIDDSLFKDKDTKVLRFHRSGDRHEEDVKIIIRKKVRIEDMENKNSDLKLDKFNYYPNPSNGIVKLQFENKVSSPTTIKIYDDKGNLVYMDQMENLEGKYDKQIDLSDKKKGTYFLEIGQKKKSMKKKIIIE